MIVFALAIFTGAFLLFLVQPLIGKYILPWFGGGPGVWTSCLLFFQVALVGGYAYAHLVSSRLRPRAQAILHLVLVAAALLLLPITPTASWKPDVNSDPTLQIILLLAASVGLPYFVLSATGPLLQKWFSQARPGASPYRLYALSNAGSLLALLGYPFLIEPLLTRRAQAGLWAWGLVLYALFCGACALTLWRTKGASTATSATNPGPPLPATTRKAARASQATATDGIAGKGSPLDRALWFLLPACSSVLLIAFTNKMCQDVAVIPFLWILPLAVYLLTFIICFDSPRWYIRGPFTVALALVFAGIVWVLPRTNVAPMALQLCIYSAGLFVSCMVCHGEVYRLRPEPRHLTAFYLAISVGGALGGVFVALIAPLIFSDYFELHWGLALCGGLLFALWLRPGASRPAWWLRPAWACMAAGLLCFGAALWHHENASRASRVARSRNFYGVLTLLKEEPKSSALGHLKLMHGTILHGVQLVGPSVAATPTAYYSEDSGIGLAFKALPPNSRRVGLVGLGVGTVAAYAREGDYFRFYEINPEVARLAAATFTFLTNCQGRADVVLGDGRLSLEKEPAQEFDLMVLDAFSSDAIPVHLLTSEAFDVYERHIKTNGIIAVHLSNRHLELEPVLAELASRRCLQAVVIDHAAQGDKWWVGPSAWMLLSRRDGFPALLRDSARPARPGSKKLSPWTDDFASLYHVLRWKAVPQMGPGPAQKEMALAFSLSEKGDMPGAIACYSRALELDPTSPSALNNAAWLLATSAEPGLRNGAEAVRLAEKACRLTNHGHTMLVGTLAAAYAEAGRFAEAISTAQKACALASQSGDQALLARNTELLELYRLGKPYFEPHARGQK